MTQLHRNFDYRKLHSHLTPVPLKKHSLSLLTPSLVQAMESNDPVTVSEFCSSIGAGSFGNPYYHCKIYHVCQKDGRTDTLPCPQGLRFNNIHGLCDWPGKVCNPFDAIVYKDSKLDLWHVCLRWVLPPPQRIKADNRLIDRLFLIGKLGTTHKDVRPNRLRLSLIQLYSTGWQILLSAGEELQVRCNKDARGSEF